MILLIDWGNTFLKFTLASQPLEQLADVNYWKNHQQVTRLTSLAELKAHLPKALDRVLIASVRNESDNRALGQLLMPLCTNLFFAKTASNACRVTCAYQQPEQLGVDRWLGVLAVDSSNSAIGVISFGTAITLDIVENQQHLGGHILPSKHLMLESLRLTAQVKADFNSSTRELELGQSTNDCVNLGIDALISSYLLKVTAEMQGAYSIKQWIITGGGSSWGSVLQQKGLNISQRSHLVFEGLIKLYSDSLD